jgi:hypothetical protein
MQKDIHKTKVKFMFREENDDLFAVFTEQDRIGADKMKLFNSYAHTGQHSDACEEYINECRPATEEEYKDLFNELENQIGYNLEVI